MAERKDYTEDYYNPHGYYETESIADDISSSSLDPDEINWQLVTANYDPREISDVICCVEDYDTVVAIVGAIATQYTHDTQDKTAINAKIQEYIKKEHIDNFNTNSGKYLYTLFVHGDPPLSTLLEYFADTHKTNINKDYVIRELQETIKEKEPKPKPQGRPTSNLFQSATTEREKSKEMKDFFLAKHNNLEIPNCKKDAHEIATIKEMVDKWQKENLFPTGKVSGTALVRFLKETGFSFRISEASLASFFNNIF